MSEQHNRISIKEIEDEEGARNIKSNSKTLTDNSDHNQTEHKKSEKEPDNLDEIIKEDSKINKEIEVPAINHTTEEIENVKNDIYNDNNQVEQEKSEKEAEHPEEIINDDIKINKGTEVSTIDHTTEEFSKFDDAKNDINQIVEKKIEKEPYNLEEIIKDGLKINKGIEVSTMDHTTEELSIVGDMKNNIFKHESVLNHDTSLMTDFEEKAFQTMDSFDTILEENSTNVFEESSRSQVIEKSKKQKIFAKIESSSSKTVTKTVQVDGKDIVSEEATSFETAERKSSENINQINADMTENGRTMVEPKQNIHKDEKEIAQVKNQDNQEKSQVQDNEKPGKCCCLRYCCIM